jgi:hypothetical protein
MRNVAVIAAALLVLCIFPTSIYAMQNEQTIDVTKSPITEVPEAGTQEAIAIDFLRNSPTYKFDGIETAIHVIDYYILKSNPGVYVFKIGFTSTSSGYGDRSGVMTAQVLTDHTIIVQVSAGKVVSAVIDDQWDELTQNDIELTADEPSNFYLSPEAARDAILNYIITTYGLGLEVPTSWTVRDATPEGLLGYQTLVYTSGDWMVSVKHAVVLHPIYTIHVEYSGSNNFTWTGSAKIQITVEESENTIQKPDPVTYYSVEDARDMALKYIQANHPEANVPFLGEWVETNLVPNGLVGATNMRFTGAGWTVTVSGPVVWKPTYTIDIEYTGTTSFKWSGTLPTGGEITETSFSK